MIDLYCGAGGAAMGYHRAGFEVIGIDLHPQPHYPFEFHQDDALDFLEAPEWPVRPDIIHASPPCQAHSSGTHLNRHREFRLFDPNRDYLTPTLTLLGQRPIPWIVENVPGARDLMPADSVTVCGSAFGLRVRRHRLFASSLPLVGTVCRHAEQGKPLGVYGHGGGQQRGATIAKRGEFAELMGMPWADWRGAGQAIPPAYTEWLGGQLLAALDRADGRPVWGDIHPAARPARGALVELDHAALGASGASRNVHVINGGHDMYNTER